MLTLALSVGATVLVCVSTVIQVQGFGPCFAWCNGRAELGHGTFGAVRVAKIITSGDLVAMKKFNGTAARADAMSEADMLTRLNN